MLSQTLKDELKNIFEDNIAFDVPLNSYTSIHIGGPADAFFKPSSVEDLQKGILWAKEKKIPYFVLGKGSNTLVRDGGFRGLILNLGPGFRHFGLSKEDGHYVWVQAQGGVPTQQLVRWCAEQGLAGLERLAGVPGTIGGNTFMNAGTHLGEIGGLVENVQLCNSKGELQEVPKEKLEFKYRHSNIPPSCVVVSTLLKLERGDAGALSKTLREIFEKRGLAQPVEIPNLGSVFKNPGKASEDLALPVRARGVLGDGAITERSEVGQRSPRYQRKAGELIEEAGCKGVRVGGARVSEKHANFIVNEGKASAKDVLILIGLIKERVKEAFGVTLEMEIKVVGE